MNILQKQIIKKLNKERLYGFKLNLKYISLNNLS